MLLAIDATRLKDRHLFSISFVVPCFNEEKNIEACVRSIQREAGKFAANFEIIVVDNLSTDGTATLARQIGAQVVECRQKGVVWARRAGYEASSCELVACVDADNILPIGWLRSAFAGFRSEDIVAVTGPVVFHDLPTLLRILSIGFFLSAWILHQFMPMMQGGNFVIRRSALEEVGGFDTSCAFYGEDTAQAVRFSKVGKIKFIPRMWLYSSARRLLGEGILRVTLRYIANYISVWLWGRPFTNDYSDIRR
jgi:glycosyltransferase involved in cell wall biosynthesis